MQVGKLKGFELLASGYIIYCPVFATSLESESIISCESQGNYTHLFLKDKRKIIASRNLNEMEELLEDYSFLRVHHSYLVNINEVEKYIKGEGGYLMMSDGSSINVSKSRKELLLKKLSLR